MSQETLTTPTELQADHNTDQQASCTGEEILEQLQSENTRLQQQITELTAARSQQDTLTERLAEAESEATELRTRYSRAALAHAVESKAIELGMSPQAASMFTSRFTCEIGSDGQPQITPDPAEVLAAELESNPLLRQSIESGRLARKATEVTAGATPVQDVDPVELMTALDRSASRKAGFIARHGAQAFIDLAETARRKGYRG